MKAIDDLKDEHIAVNKMLFILEGICKMLDSGKDVDSEHLNDLLEFMDVFVDKCHHAKEEEFLFPEMETLGIKDADEMIANLLDEHEVGRGHVSRIRELVQAYIKGEGDVSSNLVEVAREYVELMTQHTDKEDNILFPIADEHLSDEVQGKLLESFDNIEMEKIGAGKHESFHKMLHELEHIYVGGVHGKPTL